MTTRIATITVLVEIPSEESYADTLAEVTGEIEDGIQRTGLTYAWAEADPRWSALREYVDANAREQSIPGFSLVRARMAELEPGQ